MSTENSRTSEELAAESRLAIRIILIVVIALALWGVAIWIWGVVGLYMPAVASVPIIYVLLIFGTRG